MYKIIAYRRNINLGDLIGSKKILDGKVKIIARSSFIIDHALLEEIIFVVHKF